MKIIMYASSRVREKMSSIMFAPFVKINSNLRHRHIEDTVWSVSQISHGEEGLKDMELEKNNGMKFLMNKMENVHSAIKIPKLLTTVIKMDMYEDYFAMDAI